MITNRTALKAKIDALLADNNAGDITPEELRSVLYDIVDSAPTFADEPRATLSHSHVQGDVAGLAASLSGLQPVSERGQAGGYAPLDVGARLPVVHLPGHASRHATGQVDGLTAGDIGAASLSHAGRHAAGGPDPLTPAMIGAASLSHAARHATGGPDPLTPAMIGAAPEIHASRHYPGGPDPINLALLGAASATHSHSGSEAWLSGILAGLYADLLSAGGFVVDAAAGSYDVWLSTEYGGRVDRLRHATLSGTVQATLLINGVPVGGINGATASAALSSAPATSGNTFGAGARIQLSLASPSAAGGYAFQLDFSP